ncbi:hypothetical protein A5624_11620 [Mycobacterium sp. 1482292.6]|nr:hypothetical protein A5624_11620 [Mycobacterium sp. 1482292.6]
MIYRLHKIEEWVWAKFCNVAKDEDLIVAGNVVEIVWQAEPKPQGPTGMSGPAVVNGVQFVQVDAADGQAAVFEIWSERLTIGHAISHFYEPPIGDAVDSSMQADAVASCRTARDKIEQVDGVPPPSGACGPWHC